MKTYRKIFDPAGSRAIRCLVGVTVGLVLGTLIETKAATAQTVYPNDGNIEYIKFVRDGIEIKLTKIGLEGGYRRTGADNMAANVRWWHARTFNRPSAINTQKLGWQIWMHCQAYGRGWIPFWVGSKLKQHANPVNVEWSEIVG